jgi:hypothetical protein
MAQTRNSSTSRFKEHNTIDKITLPKIVDQSRNLNDSRLEKSFSSI